MSKYLIAILTLSVSLFGVPSLAEEDTPNVLFIMIDDLRPELGAYGKKIIKSPNIDRFSDQGVVFTNAYVNVPICGASRASMMTGIRPTESLFLKYYSRIDEEAKDAQTLFGYLKSRGYFTQSMGKIMHFSADSASDWTVKPWSAPNKYGTGFQNYLLRENIDMQKRLGWGPPFEAADVKDNDYIDGMVADNAVKAIKEAKDRKQPFFMAVGFVKPHLPFNAPKKYWDMYQDNEIHLADNPFQPTNAPKKATHQWGELRKYAGIPKKPLPVPDAMAKKLVHGYYASVSYIDSLVGKVLQQLERSGLSDDTIVFLLGDHGWSLGEHGLWAKHSPFDHATRTPLIVRVPSKLSNTAASGLAHGLVEFVDIFPTILELTGQPSIDQLQGESFVAQLKDPDAPGKAAVFPRYELAEVIKTKNFALTEWYSKKGKMLGRMLYDHRVDPEETYNVAEEPEYQSVVEDLHNQLVTLMKTR